MLEVGSKAWSRLNFVSVSVDPTDSCPLQSRLLKPKEKSPECTEGEDFVVSLFQCSVLVGRPVRLSCCSGQLLDCCAGTLAGPKVSSVNGEKSNVFWPAFGVSFRFGKGREFIRIL